ncbi:MAG: BadF/BadG/BcrA/BcrD ATPase family protein [Longimicrobiales bacterium]|nr:BadF/BadG/BcrA/BcrD ATPase family protein [Longimicrobiales bacterium]
MKGGEPGRLFVGVDGGGTSTRAVLVDREGRELARSEDAGAVATTARPEDAAQAVERAVSRAVAGAGLTGPVDVLWAGLAGAGSQEARVGVVQALEAMELARHVHVGTDVEAAYHDVFGREAGVLLIAGTGSIAWARDAEGRRRRVGGWGQLLGDEGSGYWIGMEALRHAVRSADGREAPTALTEELEAACGVDGANELVPWVERASKAEVARLAPGVVRLADEGDAAACAVVDAAVASLVELARVAAGGSDTSREVVLWGGLVAPGGPLRERVRRELTRARLAVREVEVDPPMGAARLALESAAGR